jgi:hypothetical protein
MRLPGDEEHTQVLAHHIDLDHRDVVLERQLVLARIDLEFHDAAPGMV